jgi:hypothetical protein
MAPPDDPPPKPAADSGSSPPEFDLEKDKLPGPTFKLQGEETSLHSEKWADIARPFTYFILSLLAIVVILPFLLPFWIDPKQVTVAFDWAKTVLAPITGFGGAVIGYYYGTRGQK